MRCKAGSGWVLLDRANRDPSKALSATPQKPSSTGTSMELEKIAIKGSEARLRAQEILARWKSNSPDLVKMIEHAIDRVPYFKTSSEFALSRQFTVSDELRKLCPGLEVKTAILYLPKFGSIVSEPLWNSLDADTQAGLLIHEALRQIQFAYQYGTKNGDLEAITAHLMDGDPAQQPWPQDSPHIQGMLRRYFQAWRSYRKQFGSNAPSDPKQMCSAQAISDVSKLMDSCMFALAISANLSTNDVIEEHQVGRTEKDLHALWKQLVDRKLLSAQKQD